MATKALMEEMTDAQFDHHAMTILARELGLGGFARFLRLHRSGTGDYARDRDQWLANMTLDDILRELNPQL